MHYKNGREAHDGEPVVAETYTGSGKHVAGVLHSTTPGSCSCNGQLAYPIPGGTGHLCVTVGNIYHAGDAFAAIEPKAIEPHCEIPPQPPTT